MTKAEFDAWHAAYKTEHRYPVQGRNAASGKLVNIGWTTDYVAPDIIDVNDVRVLLDPAKVLDSKGVAFPIPGKPAPEPVRKADGTIDVVQSKAELAVFVADDLEELQ